MSIAMRAGDLLALGFVSNLEHSAAMRAVKLHRGHRSDNPKERQANISILSQSIFAGKPLSGEMLAELVDYHLPWFPKNAGCTPCDPHNRPKHISLGKH